MKNKDDKSLEEVWEMKKIAHERFVKSEYRNYAEYLKFRQKSIDDIMNNKFHEQSSYVTS